MPRAVWNDTVIAESDDTVIVDGNHYFPRESCLDGRLEPCETTTVCGWKGTANYFDVVADGERNAGAAWMYADPKPAAAEIKDHVAFWKGVTVEGGSGEGGKTGDCDV